MCDGKLDLETQCGITLCMTILRKNDGFLNSLMFVTTVYYISNNEGNQVFLVIYMIFSFCGHLSCCAWA